MPFLCFLVKLDGLGRGIEDGWNLGSLDGVALLMDGIAQAYRWSEAIRTVLESHKQRANISFLVQETVR